MTPANLSKLSLGSVGQQVEVLHAMLGTMDPMWAPSTRDKFNKSTLKQVQKMLRLLNYPYFLDEVVTGEAWVVLANEYSRFVDNDVDTIEGYGAEVIRLDTLHRRISELMGSRDDV